MMARDLLVRSAALVGLAVLAVPAAPAAQRDLDLRRDFPAAEGKLLDVDAADLDLRVRVADVSQIEATVQLHISGTGGDTAELWIEGNTPRFDDSPDRLGINVPGRKAGILGFGRLTARARLGVLTPGSVVPDLSTTGGNITVRGDFPNARPLWMRSASGTLSLVGAAAAVDARSVEGDVEVSVVRPLESFSASTSSGNVRFVGGARATSVGTASGDIWLQNLSGDLEVSTTTGRLTVSWDRLGPDGRVRIRSSSGRVHLMVPAGVSPRGRLATTTGNVRSELPGEVEADGGTLRLSGDGPTFDVETASGEIVLGVRDPLD